MKKSERTWKAIRQELDGRVKGYVKTSSPNGEEAGTEIVPLIVSAAAKTGREKRKEESKSSDLSVINVPRRGGEKSTGSARTCSLPKKKG